MLSKLKADPALAPIPVVVVTVVDDRTSATPSARPTTWSSRIDRERLAEVLRRVRAAGMDSTVLVVEDDALTRQILRRLLEREGWRVTEAENGRVGLERIAERVPGLVLLDLMMPEMDGFEFVTELRKREDGWHVPVVVLTAKDPSEEDRRRLQGAVARILQKGEHSNQEVVAEVRRLLESRKSALPAASA